MTKVELYRQTLRSLPLSEWEGYLLRESGLPGPRGNLELAQAAADEGSRELFDHLLTFTAEAAPVNDPHEFLAFCGVVGLGRLIAEGETDLIEVVRPFASDPRWRMREGVAMALQRWGKADMAALLKEMHGWSRGGWLEKRAAVAALAEPALLHDPASNREALGILNEITASMENSAEAQSADYKVLAQGLSYCWSVAAAAEPEAGKPLMEKWLASADPVIRKIMRENLKKNRLRRMDAEWVERMAGL